MLPRILLLAYILTSTAAAQQYPFVHYTPKDGLVNSRVRAAYQDSKGRMYFMTFGGLSVYDGARFQNYTPQNGLISQIVNDVLEVGEDSFLVAVNTPGLNVLVRGRMQQLKLVGDKLPVINQFLKANDGTIFISADEGLYKLIHNRIEKLSVVSSAGAPIEYLGFITSYKDIIIFTINDLASSRGLFAYNKATGKISDALEKLTVYSVSRDYNGIVWVSLPPSMQVLDTAALASGKLVLRQPYNTSRTLPSGSIGFNRQNEPMISPDTKEIIRFGKNGEVLTIASPDPSGVGMQSFFIDRENILWVCNDGNGVYKLPNTYLQTKQFIFPQNKSGIRYVRAFNGSSFWAVMRDDEWILSTPSGTKSFTVRPSVGAIPLQWTKTHLYAVKDNQLFWARVPEDNDRLLSFQKIIALPDTSGFGGESIIDPYGNIILFENRNIIAMRDTKIFFSIPYPFYDLIQGLHIDKHKQLWSVSRSAGLTVFSLHPEDPAHYLHKESQFIEEFDGASPRCMVVDKNEVLWVGTRYDGLMAFTYSNKQLRRLHHFRLDNGLTDNFITAVTCDTAGNLIVGTQTGLDRLIRLKDGGFRIENITRSNNIFTYIYALWNDSFNNTFALSAVGTIYQLEPVKPASTAEAPHIFIAEMKVNGETVQQPTSFHQLEYYQRNINFSVAAPTFIDEKQVQYSFLLEGSGNTKWSDTSSVADIPLLNLPSGNYTLRVKAFFPSTSYSSKELSFAFTILPPWWQTWWFRTIAGILFIGLLVWLTRFYYLRKLEKQKNILERKQAVEKERTRIATDMHDDLGAGLSRIKFLSETIGIKKQQQQPIEEDISKIREYSHEMIDKMGEIVWALNEKNDSLSDLLSYTRSYAVEYLSQNGIDCKFDLPEYVPSAFVTGEFRRNIFLVVKEVLHNVVKHAQANRVVITIETGHALSLRIADDGIGFDPANTRPYSNGLTNIKKRVKDIGGTIDIQVTNGTAILVKAPLSL